jgi:hypothetical protein
MEQRVGASSMGGIEFLSKVLRAKLIEGDGKIGGGVHGGVWQGRVRRRGSEKGCLLP